MGKTYRVGIIGLSQIAAGRAPKGPHESLGELTPRTHAGAFDRFPQCEVAGVCDLSQEQRAAFVERWGARWPRLRAFADAREMLAACELDIVSVATPDHLHRDLVHMACEAGVKGILCEKPLATTLEDCDAMIDACRRSGVKMNVDHTYRWLPSYTDAKEAIATGRIGEVRHIVGYLGGPRAMMFRNGTHLVDLLNYLAGGSPVWVSAELEDGFDHFRDGYRGDGGREATSEPGANATIAYDNGVRATYVGMKGAVKDFGVTVYGSMGKIHVDAADERLWLQSEHGLVGRGLQMYDALVMRREYRFSGVAGAVSDLLRAIETDGPTMSPAEEARKAVAVLLGMIDSHFRDGARVRLS